MEMSAEKRLSPSLGSSSSPSNSNIFKDPLAFIFVRRRTTGPEQRVDLSAKENAATWFVECCTCNVVEASPAMFIHAANVHGVFLCVYCLKFYIFAKQLVAHLDTDRGHGVATESYASLADFVQHGGNDTRLLCVHCCNMFSSQDLKTRGHECSKRSAICHKCGAVVHMSLLHVHDSLCRGSLQLHLPGNVNLRGHQNVLDASVHFNSFPVASNTAAKRRRSDVGAVEGHKSGRNKNSLPPIPKLLRGGLTSTEASREPRAMPKLILRPNIRPQSPVHVATNVVHRQESSTGDKQLHGPAELQLKAWNCVDAIVGGCQKTEDRWEKIKTDESEKPEALTANVVTDDEGKERHKEKKSRSKASESAARFIAQDVAHRPRRSLKRVARDDFLYSSVVKKARAKSTEDEMKGKKRNGRTRNVKEKVRNFVVVERLALDALLVEADASQRVRILVEELCSKLGAERVERQDAAINEFNLCRDESSDVILAQMLRVTAAHCRYCRQAKLIRVDKRQLALHLLTAHLWNANILATSSAPTQPQSANQFEKNASASIRPGSQEKKKESNAGTTEGTSSTISASESHSTEENEKVENARMDTTERTAEMDGTDFKLLLLDKVFRSDCAVFTYSEPKRKAFGDVACECLVCGCEADTQRNLFAHWRKCHRWEPMRCAMCQGKFLFSASLFCHLCLGTPSPVTAISTSPWRSGEQESRAGDEDLSNHTSCLRYACGLCEDVQLPGFFNLMVHLRKEHVMCELCLQTCGTQHELARHLKNHKLNSFCWKCGVTYCDKQNFVAHLLWKHGSAAERRVCCKCLQNKWTHCYHFCFPAQRFTCDVCRHVFTNPKSLQVHQRLHTQLNLKSCSHCQEKFVSRKLLLKHVQSQHVQAPQMQTPSGVVATQLGQTFLAPPTEEHSKAARVNPQKLDSQLADGCPATPPDEEVEESEQEREAEMKSVPGESGTMKSEMKMSPSAEGATKKDCGRCATMEGQEKHFNIEEVKGPNLSEDSDCEDDEWRGRCSSGPPPAVHNAKHDDQAEMQMDENCSEDVVDLQAAHVRVDERFVEWPLRGFNLAMNSAEEYQLPEHIRQESAMFTLANEHDYCVSPLSAAGQVDSSTKRVDIPAPKKLKICRPSASKCRPRERSCSSSSSSCCPTSCSCSSSCSTSESGSSSDSEQEATIAKSGKCAAEQVAAKKSENEMTRDVDVVRDEDKDEVVAKSDLDTDDSDGEQMYDKKQLTEIVGNGISPHDQVWQISNENFLLRLVRGVADSRHLLPKC